MKFKVNVDQTMTRSWEVDVEADTLEEAFLEARNMADAEELGDNWTFTDWETPTFWAEQDDMIVEG